MSTRPVKSWQFIAGLVAAALATPTIAPATEPAFAIELEAGLVRQSGNTVQIPSDQNGSRFSLEQLVGSGPWPAARLYFNWDISERNGLRLVVAPLSYTESGVFDQAVNFNGATFLPGMPTEATYKFNSWRLGYRYRFREGKRWTWWVPTTESRVLGPRTEVDWPPP